MQLNSIISQLDQTLGLWSNALIDYKERDLIKQPNRNHWSIGQLYVHLIEETNWFLGQAEISLVTSENVSDEMTEKAKKMFLSNEFPEGRVKGMATVDNVPQPKNKAQLIANFLELIKRVQSITVKDSENVYKGKTQHPGLGYFNALEWFQYAEMHLRHHLRQKKRIDSFLNRH